jgi:PAS domain S-box-containing protein
MTLAKAKLLPAALLKSLMPALVSSAMDAIILVDETGRIILFNAAAERMFQCRQPEALGQKLDRFIPEAHRRHILAREAETPESGIRNPEPLLARRADGLEFPVEASISRVEADGKKMFAAILRDSTERVHAEELRSWMAAIVESSNDAIIGKDLNGLVTSWNGGAEKIFGYSCKEMIGQSVARLIPPDHADEDEQIHDCIRNGRHMKPFDTVRRRKDGRLIDVSIMMSPVKDATGRVVGASTVARDIAAGKRIEQELRRREEYFRTLIEYASDVITLVDPEGVIHFQSPSIERVLNLKPEMVSGRNLAELIHPEDWPRLAAMIRRAFSNPDSPVAIEYRIRHRDGAWHLFSSVGRSIPHDVEGLGIVFNSCDITASRNLEEQLLQAQKMEAIGTLTGGIAHDFNNMLAGILGSAELVREDLPASHPTQEYVQSIITAANRARELVQQILTFSRRRESAKQVMSLQPIVGECVKLLRSAIPAMVKITHHVETGCPPVLADPTQIHQVIMNIFTNAWQALPDTGGHIDISLRAVEVDAALLLVHPELRMGDFVRLTIADNGQGMDAKTRERIFEPFFTTKPASKGSGLGLSVVQGIVKSHRGTILVESAPGRGTSFQVYLPASTISRKEPSAPVVAVPHGHGERILFVDDEPIVARSTEELLKRLGYAVTCCEQSENALEQFRRAPREFDLIVTDWAMPGMSGTELVSAMRETRPDIPMLLMSGFVDSTVQQVAKMIGIDEVLVKPVNPELLAQAIAQVLARGARAAKDGAGQA